MANKISVTMLTKNASEYLRESLGALKRFDEIIVVDNGSTDETIQILKEFPNVICYTSPFIGFGPLKNLAVSKTTHDWILSVDSDEIFTEALVDEILNLQLDRSTVYAIKRDNFYNKKHIKCCGWDKDYVSRLFHKKQTSFNNKQVHESLVLGEHTDVVKLHHSFKHYSFKNAAQLLHKMNHYSTLYAQEHCQHKSATISKALYRAFFAFIKNYFFQKGFLYGYEGLLISVSNANGVFYKYIKLIEENHQ